MRRVASSRWRDDGGAVIVEAALVLPILFAFIFGLIEYSNTEFQQSQATSGARDGARAGIVLDYTKADQVGNQVNTDIQAAAKAKLGNQQGVTVQVWCVKSDGNTTVACNSPELHPGDGFLRVRVNWPYRSVTGMGLLVPSTISGTSQMSLVGAAVTVSTTSTTSPPSTVTPPTSTPASSTTSSTSTSTTSTTQAPTTTQPGCAIKSVSPETPLPTVNTKNGHLTEDLVVELETNGSLQCPTVSALAYPSGGGAASGSTVTGNVTGSSTYSASFRNNDKWQPGPVLVRFTWGTGGTSDAVVDLKASK